MTWNFILRLRMVFADRVDMSREWLEAAMFGKDTALAGLKTFGHDPRGSGRPNSGSEPEGSDISNPWEYILMVEGMLMFAGGISKRVGQRHGWSAFPFVSESTKAGYGTAADEEDRGGLCAGGHQSRSGARNRWVPPVWCIGAQGEGVPVCRYRTA